MTSNIVLASHYQMDKETSQESDYQDRGGRTMSIREGNLPDKLSELIVLAVNDMEALDRQEYLPVSRVWHEKMQWWDENDEAREVCVVCLAGAVMSRQMGFGHDDSGELYIRDSNSNDRKKLVALELVRVLNFIPAVAMFYAIPAQLVHGEAKDLGIKVRNKYLMSNAFYSWKTWNYIKPAYLYVADKLKKMGY